LPTAHAAFLTGDRAANIAPMASTLRALGGALPELEQCLRDGGGLSRSVFASHMASAGADTGDLWRRIYDEQLVDGFIGAVGGLAARLAAGVRVLDLGCGTGHAVNVLARAFPQSRFVGMDIDPRVIGQANAERAGLGLGNATFEVADAAQLQPGSPFDVILAFDAVHDQHSPGEVLRRVRAALSPGGMFVMVDAKFSSRLENNVGNPFAPLCYAISLLYCTPVSLADDGAGLGAMWGTELACEMLADAGFSDVEMIDSPRPQNCLYVCRV
jgi:SAM-dependent methyltransferase